MECIGSIVGENTTGKYNPNTRGRHFRKQKGEGSEDEESEKLEKKESLRSVQLEDFPQWAKCESMLILTPLKADPHIIALEAADSILGFEGVVLGHPADDIDALVCVEHQAIQVKACREAI